MLNLEVYHYKIDKNINKLKRYEVMKFKNMEDIYNYLIDHNALDPTNCEDDLCICSIIKNKYCIAYNSEYDYVIYRLLA